MDIRLLTSDDWKIFRHLRLQALQHNPESFAGSFEEEAAMPNEEFKKNYCKSTFFGAFSADQLIGCIGFFKRALPKMHHKGVIFGMYIAPEFRHHGIADGLMKAVIHHASSRVMQLHLMVATLNHEAVALYQSNGFEIYGTELRSLKVKETFYDEYLMVLMLTSDKDSITF